MVRSEDSIMDVELFRTATIVLLARYIERLALGNLYGQRCSYPVGGEGQAARRAGGYLADFLAQIKVGLSAR